MGFISCHITPLIINSIRGGHTHTHKHVNTRTYRRPHRNNFKKPGATGPPGLKLDKYIYHSNIKQTTLSVSCIIALTYLLFFIY